jgi:hypothetical protein
MTNTYLRKKKIDLDKTRPMTTIYELKTKKKGLSCGSAGCSGYYPCANSLYPISKYMFKKLGYVEHLHLKISSVCKCNADMKDATQPQRRIAEPQVRPAPKPAVAIVWPGLTFPLLTASSKAKGMEAALVLP